MNKNFLSKWKFLPSEWLITAKGLLIETSQGKGKIICEDPCKFKEFEILRLESFVNIDECTLKISELENIKLRTLRFFRGLHGVPLVDSKSAIAKNVDKIIKDIKCGKSTFNYDEIRTTLGDDFDEALGSITGTISSNQRKKLQVKLEAYISSFIQNELSEPGLSIYDFEVYKYNFALIVKKKLEEGQPESNLHVTAKDFPYRRWHFFEMILALEQLGFIAIREIEDVLNLTNESLLSRKIIVSSNDAYQYYAKFSITEQCKKYCASVLKKNNDTSEKSQNTLDADKALLILADREGREKRTITRGGIVKETDTKIGKAQLELVEAMNKSKGSIQTSNSAFSATRLNRLRKGLRDKKVDGEWQFIIPGLDGAKEIFRYVNPIRML